MKKLFLLPIIALIFSCDSESTGEVSSVTNYPNFEVMGDEVIFVMQGETYTDPGVVVTEAGEEIEYQTTISGTYRGGTSVDTNVSDIYQVTYSAVNQDGFPGSASRTVIVVDDGDLVNSISGLYRSTVTRNGLLEPAYVDMEYILIWENEDGTYEMSDGIGGYYAIGRAYGLAYAARPVIITANSIPGNDFSVEPFSVGAFGGSAVMSDITVNPDAGTITFTTVWDQGYTFSVVLEKVEI